MMSNYSNIEPLTKIVDDVRMSVYVDSNGNNSLDKDDIDNAKAQLAALIDQIIGEDDQYGGVSGVVWSIEHRNYLREEQRKRAKELLS